MPARFYEQEVASGLKNKRKLSAYLDGIIRRKRKKIKQVSLTYIFCNDEALLEINSQFLNHHTYTDIITFDLSESNERLQGEIYISAERVKENAAKYENSYEDELYRVIFHGALHLCGYQDKSKTEKEEMRRQENLCLAQYKKIV